MTDDVVPRQRQEGWEKLGWEPHPWEESGWGQPWEESGWGQPWEEPGWVELGGQEQEQLGKKHGLTAIGRM